LIFSTINVKINFINNYEVPLFIPSHPAHALTMHKLLDIKRSIIEIIPLAFATSSTMLSFLFTVYRDNNPSKIN